MKREVDYEKAWKLLGRRLSKRDPYTTSQLERETYSVFELKEIMTVIRKKCTRKQTEDEFKRDQVDFSDPNF